jgi:hypothetical protein
MGLSQLWPGPLSSQEPDWSTLSGGRQPSGDALPRHDAVCRPAMMAVLWSRNGAGRPWLRVLHARPRLRAALAWSG